MSELERYDAAPAAAGRHPRSREVAGQEGPLSYVPEPPPVNKTTVVVLGMGFVTAGVVILIIASLVFVACMAAPPPPPDVVNPNCARWCMN